MPSTSTSPLHTHPVRWTRIDGTRVLCIEGSSFAAKPDHGAPDTWAIFFVPTRQIISYIRGKRDDVKQKLIESERSLLTQREGR